MNKQNVMVLPSSAELTVAFTHKIDPEKCPPLLVAAPEMTVGYLMYTDADAHLRDRQTVQGISRCGRRSGTRG